MTSLVVNRGARKGEGLAQAQAALASAGVELYESFAVAPEELGRTVEAAARSGPVVVAGGDGTLSLAARAVAGAGAEIAILPMGTQNSFARSLGIPLDLEEAARVVADGQTRKVDLGAVNGRIFTHSVTIGISTEVAQETEPALKRVVGQAAYLLVGSRALATHQPFFCRFETDEGTFKTETHQVLVTNGALLGATTPAPDARPDDHLLHVATLGTTRWAFVRGWAAAAAGADLPEGSQRFSARDILLTTYPPQRLDVDGDAGTLTPARLQVVPDALQVRLP